MNDLSNLPNGCRAVDDLKFSRCEPLHTLTLVLRDGTAMQTQSQTDLPLRIPERKQDQP